VWWACRLLQITAVMENLFRFYFWVCATQMAEEDLQGTEVVFRSGSAQNPMDLRRGAAETARSIVIMATGHSYDAADAATLRAVLALSTFPELRGHVVVEVHDKVSRCLPKGICLLKRL